MRPLPFVILWLFGLLLANDPARAAVEQRIVAVVNDEVISAQDLNDRLQLVTLTSGIPDSAQARARLAPQVLRSLIEETLQLQEAERLEITVEDAEIQRALANIAQRNQMTVEAMQRFFAQNGINLATLLEQVRAQIAWVKVVQRQIVPRVTVTVDQLDMAVEEARRNEGEPEYLLSEIVVPVDNPAQAQVVAQDAARLVQTLREGASFESLARQVSAAASAENGGDVGWIRSSAIPQELRGRDLRSHPIVGRLLHIPAARQAPQPGGGGWIDGGRRGRARPDPVPGRRRDQPRRPARAGGRAAC
jgi:peptidyl-prolyl cis-trans isomerase SurA